MKAMIVNRIGDVGIALAMFVAYDTFKTLDFESMFAMSYLLGDGASISGPLGSNANSLTILGLELDRLTLIGILFLIGAAGKSAQMGLHT